MPVVTAAFGNDIAGLWPDVNGGDKVGRVGGRLLTNGD